MSAEVLDELSYKATCAECAVSYSFYLKAPAVEWCKKHDAAVHPEVVWK